MTSLLAATLSAKTIVAGLLLAAFSAVAGAIATYAYFFWLWVKNRQ